MGKNFDDDIEEVELDSVILPDENGVEHEYGIIANFFIRDTDYVALCPLLENGFLDEEKVFFYRSEENGEELNLEDITSAEELEEVMRTYEELCSEEED